MRKITQRIKAIIIVIVMLFTTINNNEAYAAEEKPLFIELEIEVVSELYINIKENGFITASEDATYISGFNIRDLLGIECSEDGYTYSRGPLSCTLSPEDTKDTDGIDYIRLDKIADALALDCYFDANDERLYITTCSDVNVLKTSIGDMYNELYRELYDYGDLSLYEDDKYESTAAQIVDYMPFVPKRSEEAYRQALINSMYAPFTGDANNYYINVNCGGFSSVVWGICADNMTDMLHRGMDKNTFLADWGEMLLETQTECVVPVAEAFEFNHYQKACDERCINALENLTKSEIENLDKAAVNISNSHNANKDELPWRNTYRYLSENNVPDVEGVDVGSIVTDSNNRYRESMLEGQLEVEPIEEARACLDIQKACMRYIRENRDCILSEQAATTLDEFIKIKDCADMMVLALKCKERIGYIMQNSDPTENLKTDNDALGILYYEDADYGYRGDNAITMSAMYEYGCDEMEKNKAGSYISMAWRDEGYEEPLGYGLEILLDLEKDGDVHTAVLKSDDNRVFRCVEPDEAVLNVFDSSILPIGRVEVAIAKGYRVKKITAESDVGRLNGVQYFPVDQFIVSISDEDKKTVMEIDPDVYFEYITRYQTGAWVFEAIADWDNNKFIAVYEVEDGAVPVIDGKAPEVEKPEPEKPVTYNGGAIDGADLARKANSYFGLKYVYGGENLNSGVDCSGFTRAIYKMYGIELPHRAAEQAKCGTPISKQEALPGDLCVYTIGDGSGSYSGHCGIYLGNGTVLQADPGMGLVCYDADYDYEFRRVFNNVSSVSTVTDYDPYHPTFAEDYYEDEEDW